MVSLLLRGARGTDGAGHRLHRAAGRAVAGGARRAAGRCWHRPNARLTDGRRPLVSRHARDLRSPSRARPVAVRGGASPPLRRSPRRTRIGRLRAAGGVLPGTDELEAGAGSVAEAQVVDVPEKSRYELRLGGRLIGLAAYRRRDGRIAFTHTEVDESCEGRGFGSLLAAAALENAEREGLEVAPLCPFIAHYIKRHPEYEPLLASGYAHR